MTELGDYLRSVRARTEPAESIGPRRVSGLRREEVAVLAGVSTDYYTRLEQGRERGPSAQVLGALAMALSLDDVATAHLYRLAGLGGVTSPATRRGHVDAELLRMLDAFPASAAYVLSPSFDVLATNAMASALLAPFEGTENMVRVLFHHRAARAVFIEWDAVASSTVHALRLNAGLYPGDRDILDLVGDLRERSAEFRMLWDENVVGNLARAFKVFEHPKAGRIELTYQTFDVRDSPGQQLLVGTPTQSSAEAVTLL